MLKLNRTGNELNRETRNNDNENWAELEKKYNDVVGEITEEVFDKIVDGSKIDWSKMVDTVADLPSDAEIGETRGVKEDNKIYRFDGSSWIPIAEINLNPIAEVDERLTQQLAQTSQEIGEKDSLPAWLKESLREVTKMHDNYLRDSGVNINQPPYNANPDGVTDNKAIFQQAIDDLGVDGGIIKFSGRIAIKSHLTYDADRVVIIGEHKAELVIPSDFDSSMGVIDSQAPNRTIKPGTTHGIKFKNFHIDSSQNENVVGFKLSGFAGASLIHEVTMTGGKGFAWINGSWSFNISDCSSATNGTFTNKAGDTGIWLGDADNGVEVGSLSIGVNRANIFRNKLLKYANFGIFAKQMTNGEITENNIEACGVLIKILRTISVKVKYNYLEHATTNLIEIGYADQTRLTTESCDISENYCNPSTHSAANPNAWIFILSMMNTKVEDNYFHRSIGQSRINLSTNNEGYSKGNRIKISEESHLMNPLRLSSELENVVFVNNRLRIGVPVINRLANQNYNFDDNEEALENGVPYGGLYHTNGVVKIRI